MEVQAKMPRVRSCSTLESMYLDLTDSRERLEGLLRQEQRHYLCDGYIDAEHAVEPQKQGACRVVEECARIVSDLSFSSSNEPMQTVLSSVCVKELADSQTRSSFLRDEKSITCSKLVGFWRSQMVSWSYLVMDSFGIDREIVAVSFNILDRYVAKEMKSSIPITREDFQLFAMTALFIGVKLLETFPRKLTALSLVEMSRGFYSAEDITMQEQEILRTLRFFVCPTTIIGFCRIYWDMFPAPVSFEVKGVCQSLAESALSDTFFMTKKSSTVGLAVVLLAAGEEGYPMSTIEVFLSRVKGSIDTLCNKDFNVIYQRLQLLSHKQ